MSALDSVRAQIPEVARDIKVNLQSVMQPGTLSAGQRWGVAVAVAAVMRDRELTDALIQDALVEAGPAVVEDALAAASLMAMNNVYYRFRHLSGKASYAEKPARLRMTRLAKPATNKADFELICLAVSAVNACETCIQAHERVVLEGGLTEEHVHDAVRIAATVHATAVSLTFPNAAGAQLPAAAAIA